MYLEVLSRASEEQCFDGRIPQNGAHFVGKLITTGEVMRGHDILKVSCNQSFRDSYPRTSCV